MFNKKLPFGPGPFLNYEAQFKDIRILALDTLLDGQIQGAASTRRNLPGLRRSWLNQPKS